jgi:hypothetical protein
VIVCLVIEVAATGIDTWSPCWYVAHDSPASKAMKALATNNAARGKLIPGEIDGHRVGFHASSSMIYAEGHPVDGDTLGDPESLQERWAVIEHAIEDVGVPLPKALHRKGSALLGSSDEPGRAGVRRLDVTVDVTCSTGQEGLAVLTGVAAVDPGRLDRDVRFNGRGIGTVSWLGARGKLGRVYDKGVEAGSAPRGQLLRFEAQYRWPWGLRREPCELTSSYVRDMFAKRFTPVLRASNGIKVVTEVTMREQLREAVRSGELTIGQAEKVLGYQLLTAGGAGLDRELVGRQTDYRRRRLIAESGFVLADGAVFDEEVDVDLADVLEEALESETWERRAAS